MDKHSLHYSATEEDTSRYEKAHVGTIVDSGSAFILKNVYHNEGLFTIRVTPMGDNLCLLEDLIEGEVTTFLRECKDWWGVWFKEIRPWMPIVVNPKRLVWLRCFEIPCHAWNDCFLNLISTWYLFKQ